MDLKKLVSKDEKLKLIAVGILIVVAIFPVMNFMFPYREELICKKNEATCSVNNTYLFRKTVSGHIDQKFLSSVHTKSRRQGKHGYVTELDVKNGYVDQRIFDVSYSSGYSANKDKNEISTYAMSAQSELRVVKTSWNILGYAIGAGVIGIVCFVIGILV